MRKFTDFMIWNHVFMAYEVYRGYYALEGILCMLGGITTVLSIYCHLHNECRCNKIESFFAKGTEVYSLLASIYYLPLRNAIELTLFKVFMYIVWRNEHYNYEKIHPWMHLLVAMDAHYYITCYYDTYNK